MKGHRSYTGSLLFCWLIAVLLAPSRGSAQRVQAEFEPTIEHKQKFETRSAQATVTTKDGSALSSQDYVFIGTVRAWQKGTKEKPGAAEALRAAALGKAAEAGGDVVFFYKDVSVEDVEVPTGKTKRTCTDSDEVLTRSEPIYSQHCYTDPQGNFRCEQQVTGYNPVYARNCKNWEETTPVTRKEKGLVSEGTVWRYDPKLSADILQKKKTLEWMRSAFPESRSMGALKANETIELRFEDPPSCTITIVLGGLKTNDGKPAIRDTIIDLALIDPDSITWETKNYDDEKGVGFLEMWTTNGEKVITEKTEIDKDAEPVLQQFRSVRFFFNGPDYAERFAKAFKNVVTLCGGKVSTTVPWKSP